MTTSVTIPTLETERLILRAPRAEDVAPAMGFYTSSRAQYVGGPYEPRPAARFMALVAGLWVTEGISSFVATRKDTGQAIGSMGPWKPPLWPEMEVGWTLWDAAHEGQGFITEGMRLLLPWLFEQTGLSTCVSYIDTPNQASKHVAQALGATLDAAESARLSAPGGFFETVEGGITVWRHQKGQTT